MAKVRNEESNNSDLEEAEKLYFAFKLALIQLFKSLVETDKTEGGDKN